MIIIPDLAELHYIRSIIDQQLSMNDIQKTEKHELSNSTQKNLEFTNSLQASQNLSQQNRNTINLNDNFENDNSHFENINFTIDHENTLI